MGSIVVKAVFGFIKSVVVGMGVKSVIAANIIAGVITAGLAVGTARAFGS